MEKNTQGSSISERWSTDYTTYHVHVNIHPCIFAQNHRDFSSNPSKAGVIQRQIQTSPCFRIEAGISHPCPSGGSLDLDSQFTGHVCTLPRGFISSAHFLLNHHPPLYHPLLIQHLLFVSTAEPPAASNGSRCWTLPLSTSFLLYGLYSWLHRRITPLFFPLVSALLAASLFSGCPCLCSTHVAHLLKPNVFFFFFLPRPSFLIGKHLIPSTPPLLQ